MPTITVSMDKLADFCVLAITRFTTSLVSNILSTNPRSTPTDCSMAVPKILILPSLPRLPANATTFVVPISKPTAILFTTGFSTTSSFSDLLLPTPLNLSNILIVLIFIVLYMEFHFHILNLFLYIYPNLLY